MIKKPLLLACAAAFAALPLSAQETKPEQPSPPEIVSRAKAEEWVAIAPSDLLVLELAGIADGKVLKQRRVVIQLIPPPFSQGWVGNIHKLAAAKWWDGTSINRVQDNYVVQWGDATEKKALPEGLAVVPESVYKTALERIFPVDAGPVAGNKDGLPKSAIAEMDRAAMAPKMRDPYSETLFHFAGWPLAGDFESYWPTHCYGMVGVGRNLSPDTGSGAELYTVIGHAPRHLDRNIALVGRVIERHGFGQADHGKLRGAVGRPVAQADHAADGGDVDDTSGLPGQHRGQEQLAQQVGGPHVDLIETVQIRHVGLQDGADRADARVVHQHIQAARLQPVKIGRDLPALLRIRDVQKKRAQRHSPARGLRGQRGESGRFLVDGPDDGAGGRKMQGDGFADARTGAGDECLFPL